MRFIPEFVAANMIILALNRFGNRPEERPELDLRQMAKELNLHRDVLREMHVISCFHLGEESCMGWSLTGKGGKECYPEVNRILREWLLCGAYREWWHTEDGNEYKGYLLPPLEGGHGHFQSIISRQPLDPELTNKLNEFMDATDEDRRRMYDAVTRPQAKTA